MRYSILILSLVLSLQGISQCGPYKHHPLWPDTLGLAYVVPSDCISNSFLWDNGSTDEMATDLQPGPHWLLGFVDGIPGDTLHFQIEQQYWDLGQTVQPMGGLISVSIWPEVPYCNPQIFNNLACSPHPDSVVIQLLQDGIPIDSATQVSCFGGPYMWNNLPFGYTYQTLLIDHSACASIGEGGLVETFDLQGEFQLQLAASTNGSNGIIEVLQVVPDQDSPITTPLTGMFHLFQLPDEELIAPSQNGISAIWSGLPIGDYRIFFGPEGLISPIDTVVTIDVTTSIGTDRSSANWSIWPNPAENIIHWQEKVPDVWITDAMGRVLLHDQNSANVDVSVLSPGHYILVFSNGRRSSFVKR